MRFEHTCATQTHSPVTNSVTRTRGALSPGRWRKGTTRFIGLCGFNGLAHQNPRSIRLSRHQCTAYPSAIKISRAEPIYTSGVEGGSQQQIVLEAERSLNGNEGQKHPVVTVVNAPDILGTDYLRRGYFKNPQPSGLLV